MGGKKIRVLIVAVTILLVLLSIAAESAYFSGFEYRYRTRRFNKILHKKEKIIEECLKGIRLALESSTNEPAPTRGEEKLFKIAAKNGITILEYVNDRLVYWSDNEFNVPGIINTGFYDNSLISIQNGWFLAKTERSGNELFVGLHRLYYNYGFENDIINNGFADDYRLPENSKPGRDPSDSGYHIYTSEGSYLFSIIYPETGNITKFIIIPALMWSAVLLLLIIITNELVRELVGRGYKNRAVLACLLVFAVIYTAILVSGKPASLLKTELFSHYRFTMNSIIPSPGHLLVLSLLLSVWSYVFYRYSGFPGDFCRLNRGRYLCLTIMLIPGSILFLVYHVILNHLVFNSTINFEPYKVLNLDLFSLAGFFSLLLLVIVPYLYVLKVLRNSNITSMRNIAPAVLTSSLIFPVFLYNEPLMLAGLFMFYLLSVLFLWLVSHRKEISFYMTVLYSLISGLYFLLVISFLSERKTTEIIKIQAVTHSTENDPEAEHLLLDMWPVISGDTILAELMKVDYFDRSDFDSIYRYLSDSYFRGYWGNFNFNIILCGKNDSLRIGDRTGRYEECFGFFEDRMARDGEQLTGTDFYFIDTQQGRSNYLCRLFYTNSTGNINGLFIELYSDINIFQPGYSELLLDKKFHGYTKLKDYSFAKYINGEIVFRSGEYSYDKSDARYAYTSPDYSIFRQEGFRHVLYKNGNVTVIISRPSLTAGDLIISFAYLFAFIFICTNVLMLFIRRPRLRNLYSLNFRQKLQMSFVGIILISFAMIGVVITSLAIREYKTRHYSNIKEKLNSIYVELENRISMEEQISAGMNSFDDSYLNDVLIKLSNSYNTDINLYDLNGYLISTSRPEIYLRNLTSRRMNDKAYFNLIDLGRSEYLQNEKIGNLEYISAYAPFYNADNKLLTYLNLPYFRMQSVLAREVSNMIVAVINFTLLLIVITMSLAVFISTRLTSPLAMLASGLASVKLGKKSEHLSYNSNDEVGDLVRHYNRMVDELDDSARKLADSERDYAWREMAKQIAHEIKNPLTPMKLNVQQLYKSCKDGVPGFEKKLERFTRSQIEYIDSLSSIASEFSSFAKMPEANPVKVNLIEQIKTTLELFKDSANISFRITCPHDADICINADKEHLNGIFSNLIKNGIQAIPPGRDGIIKVDLKIIDHNVIVAVSDNGSGIPEAIRKKMFTPNFTTKSSGTGLGLSIVKKYVENAGGKIWFESEDDTGTVFYIEFPLAADFTQ